LPVRFLEVVHVQVQVVLAVGVVAREVVKAAKPGVEVLTTRSPMRSSADQREDIRKTVERARRDAYPLGLDPDR